MASVLSFDVDKLVFICFSARARAIDFSFFYSGSLVCFEKRFGEGVVACCLLCDSYRCLEGDHVSDADVDWLVLRVGIEFGTDGSAVMSYEGYFLLGFLDFSDEFVFCYAYGGFS